jgi:dTMP kinase
MYKDQLLKDLEENDIVLLDRYVLSNIAFQGAKVEDKEKRTSLINWIRKFEFDFLGLPMADLTLFLDVPIDTIEERLSSVREGEDRDYLDGSKDIHEQDIEFQSRVRNIYKEIPISNYHIFNTYNQDGEILTPIEIFESFKHML